MPSLETSNLWRSLASPQSSNAHLSFDQNPPDVVEPITRASETLGTSPLTRTVSSKETQGTGPLTRTVRSKELLQAQEAKKKLSSVTYANSSDFTDNLSRAGPPKQTRFGTSVGLEEDFDLPRGPDA